MPLTVRDFDGVVAKLKMTSKNSSHKMVVFYHEGQAVIWTMRSHGRGEIGRVENAIRKQLRVSKQQLRDLVDCPMTREQYIEHLKAVGAIAPSE